MFCQPFLKKPFSLVYPITPLFFGVCHSLTPITLDIYMLVPATIPPSPPLLSACMIFCRLYSYALDHLPRASRVIPTSLPALPPHFELQFWVSSVAHRAFGTELQFGSSGACTARLFDDSLSSLTVIKTVSKPSRIYF